jgi:hypothetical protein
LAILLGILSAAKVAIGLIVKKSLRLEYEGIVYRIGYNGLARWFCFKQLCPQPGDVSNPCYIYWFYFTQGGFRGWFLGGFYGCGGFHSRCWDFGLGRLTSTTSR